MEKISKSHIEDVGEEMATKLVTLASAELTMTTDVEPEWQGAASQLLSTMGIRHAQLVMKELLTKFQPGGNPHYFVVYCLGMLSTANGEKLVAEQYCHLVWPKSRFSKKKNFPRELSSSMSLWPGGFQQFSHCVDAMSSLCLVVWPGLQAAILGRDEFNNNVLLVAVSTG